MKNKQMFETVADIAVNAGNMLAREEITISDSRELISDVIAWAEEFEVDFFPNTHMDYISAVDVFAIQKLKEKYGVSE